MNDQVRQNQEMVQSLIRQGEAQKAADLIQQGNRAQIPLDIDYVADSGEHFVGRFLFRRPSAMDYLKIGATRSQLLVSSGIAPQLLVTGIQDPPYIESYAHVPDTIMFLISGIAHMDHLIVVAPDWFKDYRNMEDSDVVSHVYGEYQKALLTFRRQPANPNQDSSENDGSSEAMDSSEALRGESEQSNGGTNPPADGPASTRPNG